PCRARQPAHERLARRWLGALPHPDLRVRPLRPTGQQTDHRGAGHLRALAAPRGDTVAAHPAGGRGARRLRVELLVVGVPHGLRVAGALTPSPVRPRCPVVGGWRSPTARLLPRESAEHLYRQAHSRHAGRCVRSRQTTCGAAVSAIRGLFLVVVTALLLAGATVAAGYTSQPLTEMAQAEPLVDRKERVRLPQPQVSVPEVIDHELPDWLPVAALCAAALAAVVVLILVARVVRRRVAARRSNTAPATGRRHRMADEGQLLAAVDAGLADLSDTDSDPRRAVIACWLRLEEA